VTPYRQEPDRREPSPTRRNRFSTGRNPAWGCMLLFSVAWIIVSGALTILALAVYVGQAERGRGALDPLVFVVLGVSVLVGVGLFLLIRGTRKRSRELVREAHAAEGTLFGPGTGIAADETVIPGETLRCEKCHRPLGPALVDCPDRAAGTCPYHVEHVLGPGGARIAWGLFVLGVVALAGGAVLCVTILPAGECVVLIGLLLAALGAFLNFGEGATVYNRTTGQMWQRYSLWGLTLYHVTASALQPVGFEVRPRHQMRYPASISTFSQSRDAPTILYMTLLSLLGQGALELRHSVASRVYLNISAGTRREFVLFPGEGVSRARVAGELETRIVRAVEEWAQRTDDGIETGRTFRRRTFRCFSTLDDIVLVVLGGEKGNPGDWLVSEIVAPDASQWGVGSMRGRWVEKFEPSPEYQQVTLADYTLILDVHERFKASRPDMARELWQAARRAIESCTTSSD
jgi:hypothetical protein